MEDCLIEVALEKASELGATYADLRYEENEYESISVKNEKLEGVKRSKSNGLCEHVRRARYAGELVPDRRRGQGRAP